MNGSVNDECRDISANGPVLC